MEKITLKAEKRDKVAAKRLRADGQIPAVAYSHGKEPLQITIKTQDAEKAFLKAGSNKIIGLKLGDGAAKNVIFHEVQQDPRTGQLQHADFYLVKMDEKIKTEVPLHFTGESTAVYQQEGTLVKNLEALEVEALPGDLPESIEVDISVLDDFDKSIHVSDLKIPAGVELMVEGEELVARVEPPRSDEELAELEEAPEEILPEGVADEDAEVASEPAAEEEKGDTGE